MPDAISFKATSKLDGGIRIIPICIEIRQNWPSRRLISYGTDITPRSRLE